MSAPCGGHFDVCGLKSVFPDAHVAGENEFDFIRRCGGELKRGFVYSQKRRSRGSALFDLS